MGLLDGNLDPRTQALLAAGFAGLQASGPSRTPVSLGQIMGQGGQAGLTQYNAATKAQADAAKQKQLLDLAMSKAAKDAEAEKKDAQMRAELAVAKTPEEQLAVARKYMKADTLGTTITASLDRSVHEKNTQEMAAARLTQAAQTENNNYQLRLKGLTNAADRAAETARHNAAVEGIQKQAQSLTGARLFYDTGLGAPPTGGLIPPQPSAAPTPAPVIAPTGAQATAAPAQLAVLQKERENQLQTTGQIDPALEQEIANAQKRVGGGFPTGAPVMSQGGLLGGVANPAPASLIPPAPAMPTPPNNLDARDLALQNARPQAPQVAPLAAPVAAPATPTMPTMPPEIASAPMAVQNKWKLQQTKPATAGGDAIAPDLKDVHGADYLNTLDAETKNNVNGVVNGDIDPKTFSIRNNRRSRLVAQAQQVDPTYTDRRFTTKKDFFGAGKTRDTLTSLNQSILHAGTLYELTQALANGDYPSANKIVNIARNETGDARVTNTAMAQQVLSTELMRTFRGAGAGSEREAEAFDQKLRATQGSPAQQLGVIKTAAELLNGRLKVLGDQYVQGMGNEKYRTDLLVPTAQAAWQKIKQDSETQSIVPDVSAIDAELARRRMKK